MTAILPFETPEERILFREKLRLDPNLIYGLVFHYSNTEIREILELLFTKNRIAERVEFLKTACGIVLLGDDPGKVNRQQKTGFWKSIIRSCLLPLTVLWRDELRKEYRNHPPLPTDEPEQTKALVKVKAETVANCKSPQDSVLVTVKENRPQQKEEQMNTNTVPEAKQSPELIDPLVAVFPPLPLPQEDEHRVEYVEVVIPENLKRQYKILAQKRRQEKESQREMFKKMQKRSLDTKTNLPPSLEKKDGNYQVNNAGQVLLGAFLTKLFSNLKLTEKGSFINPEKQNRAVALIQFLATGEKPDSNYTPVINNLMCGLPAENLYPHDIDLTAKETAESEKLLKSAVNLWEKIGACSNDGLRKKFLQRKGQLIENTSGLTLEVKSEVIDVLLNSLPYGWGYKTQQLPWMDKAITVKWD